MAQSYEQALGGLGALAGLPFVDAPLPSNRGRQFVFGCIHAGVSPAINMLALTNRFHNWLVNQGWIWNPAVPGATLVAGARLLDRTINTAECAGPAQALAYIINAPPPYGFGVGGATVVTYNGVGGNGFIAHHVGALPGPLPNITLPAGGTLPGHYYWGNHKVVQFGGVFYDPNYNTSYVALPHMARGVMQMVRANARLSDLVSFDRWGAKGLVRLVGQGTSDLLFGNRHTINVLCTAPGAHPTVAGHYIEWLENWQRPLLGGGGRGAIYGPYPASPLAR